MLSSARQHFVSILFFYKNIRQVEKGLSFLMKGR